MAYYLAIDVGGTAIKSALLMADGVIVEKNSIATPQDSLVAFFETINKIYSAYNHSVNIKAIVISIPGRVNSKTGYLYSGGGGALQYLNQLQLKKQLEADLKLPVFIENDAKAAALAELWQGSMKGVDNGIVLTLGTAIGGALIINGQLYKGSHFSAGEVSLCPIRLDGPYENTNIWALLNSVFILVKKYASKIELADEQVDGKMFFEALKNDDEVAMTLFDEYCQTMAWGLYSLQAVLDVDKIAIGGGISKQSILIDSINQKYDELIKIKGEATPCVKPEIVACDFGNDANLIGALYHCLQQEK